MPKVSICIPTYNQGQYIGECIQSALKQTFEDIEVVVSVNHCTDNTEAVIAEFSDPRLRVVRPDRFLLAGDNFRFCISQSRGEYFSLLCSDDMLLPEFAESQAKILDKHPNVAFVHSAAERIDKDGRLIRLEKSVRPSFLRKGTEELKRYIDGPKCVGDSALIRRSAYDAVGGYGEEVFMADWELWLRLLQYGDVAYNQRVTMKYRDWTNTDGLTRRKLRLLKGVLSLYRTYEPAILRDYPQWQRLFAKSRRKWALFYTRDLAHAAPEIKSEARAYIRQLSDSSLVRLNLILCDLGLGFIWTWRDHLLSLIRQTIKTFLYPKRVKEL